MCCYVVLPMTALKDARLKPIARLILAEIVSLTRQNGVCWAKNPYFAKEFGLKKEYVSTIISALSEYGYIKVEVRKDLGNQRNIYLAGDFKTEVEEIFDKEKRLNKNNKKEEEKEEPVSEEVAVDTETIENVEEVKPKKKKAKKAKAEEKPERIEYMKVIKEMNVLANRRFSFSKLGYELAMKNAFIEERTTEDIINCVHYIWDAWYSEKAFINRYDKKGFNPESVFRNFGKHWNKCEGNDYKMASKDDMNKPEEKFKFYYWENDEIIGTNLKMFDKVCYLSKDEALLARPL